MSFTSGADQYDRFMGRYSVPLTPKFLDFAQLEDHAEVLDVGCGPGAVSAVDPSETFVAAVRTRLPGVAVARAQAEALPFDDRSFDGALSQLVVHFMSDPVAGLREMRRVTRRGGVVAACVWDHAGGHGPLAVFWQAARTLNGDVDDESTRAGTRRGHLAELFDAAGLREVEDGSISVEVEHATFEEWWEPYTLGVGPAGAFVASLSASERDQLRELCRERLGEPPLVIAARAWAARGAP